MAITQMQMRQEKKESLKKNKTTCLRFQARKIVSIDKKIRIASWKCLKE